MKKLLFLILFLCGCITPNVNKPPVVDNFLTVDCKKAPSIWWGQKGDNPCDNDLWKCYDWILESQNNME